MQISINSFFTFICLSSRSCF